MGAIRGASPFLCSHRPDCKQVCNGRVVTPEGLPVGYEVFAGNRNDVTTLEEMVGLMEDKYGQAKRVWVTDRGIASEENLQWLRQRGVQECSGHLCSPFCAPNPSQTYLKFVSV